LGRAFGLGLSKELCLFDVGDRLSVGTVVGFREEEASGQFRIRAASN
jgi:hypothetical protein